MMKEFRVALRSAGARVWAEKAHPPVFCVSIAISALECSAGRCSSVAVASTSPCLLIPWSHDVTDCSTPNAFSLKKGGGGNCPFAPPPPPGYATDTGVVFVLKTSLIPRLMLNLDRALWCSHPLAVVSAEWSCAKPPVVQSFTSLEYVHGLI